MKNAICCCFAAVCITGDSCAGKTAGKLVLSGAPCGYSNDDGY